MQFRAAFAAEFRFRLILRTAGGAFCELQIGAAVVAEFALAGRLAADRADDLFGFDIPIEYGRFIGFCFYILDHFFGSGMRDLDVHARSAFDAKSLFFVIIVLTYPQMAFMAAVKMRFCFVLREFKGVLVLPVPFGRHAFETLAEDIRPALYFIAAADAEQGGAYRYAAP